MPLPPAFPRLSPPGDPPDARRRPPDSTPVGYAGRNAPSSPGGAPLPRVDGVVATKSRVQHPSLLLSLFLSSTLALSLPLAVDSNPPQRGVSARRVSPSPSSWPPCVAHPLPGAHSTRALTTTNHRHQAPVHNYDGRRGENRVRARAPPSHVPPPPSSRTPSPSVFPPPPPLSLCLCLALSIGSFRSSRSSCISTSLSLSFPPSILIPRRRGLSRLV